MSRNYFFVIGLAPLAMAGALCALPGCAIANDGLYQGSGFNLTLAKNSHLRVREEKLLITPLASTQCYLVYADGKVIKDRMKLNLKRAKITIGEHVSCDDASLNPSHLFYADWHASVNYDVEVMQTQQDVLFGFPIPIWNYEFVGSDGDLYYLRSPGVANFRTYINNLEVTELEVKNLEGMNKKDAMSNLLGYTWRASFEVGKHYFLKTEYDFGMDSSNSFYAGREYLSHETPWFLSAMKRVPAAERVIYYLTPIRTWAPPPPQRIDIEVKIPDGLPATYVVPLELKPVCITTTSLYYDLKNQFPTHELIFSIPSADSWADATNRPIRTLSQWRLWQRSIGGESTKVGCDVVAELKRTATSSFRSYLDDFQCAASCRE